jgi:hypothetical protein
VQDPRPALAAASVLPPALDMPSKLPAALA